MARPAIADAESQGSDTAGLEFIAHGKEYRFRTGALHGTSRSAGASRGLTLVVDIATGTTIAKGFGLFSHYRLLDSASRYGPAAWDWASESRLLPDGSVEALWSADREHPFAMRRDAMTGLTALMLDDRHRPRDRFHLLEDLRPTTGRDQRATAFGAGVERIRKKLVNVLGRKRGAIVPLLSRLPAAPALLFAFARRFLRLDDAARRWLRGSGRVLLRRSQLLFQLSDTFQRFSQLLLQRDNAPGQSPAVRAFARFSQFHGAERCHHPHTERDQLPNVRLCAYFSTLCHVDHRAAKPK
jgi:hypothetical protein